MAIIKDGLESVFTRLMQGIGINISMCQVIRDVLSDIIRDVWADKDNNRPVLGMKCENAISWMLIYRQMFSKIMSAARVPTARSRGLPQVNTTIIDSSVQHSHFLSS